MAISRETQPPLAVCREGARGINLWPLSSLLICQFFPVAKSARSQRTGDHCYSLRAAKDKLKKGEGGCFWTDRRKIPARHLLRAYYTLRAFLFNSHTTLWGRYYYYSHFQHREIEVQKDSVGVLGHPSMIEVCLAWWRKGAVSEKYLSHWQKKTRLFLAPSNSLSCCLEMWHEDLMSVCVANISRPWGATSPTHRVEPGRKSTGIWVLVDVIESLNPEPPTFRLPDNQQWTVLPFKPMLVEFTVTCS